MRIVLDNFAFKVEHHGDGAAVLLFNPIEVSEGEIFPMGVPLVVMLDEEKRDKLIEMLEAGKSRVVRANNEDLKKATKGLAVPPTQRGRSSG